ncbi:hydrogenase expression/formation protein HypE [Candidatus Dojkabacteria bacterium]|nr:hydrogenase expression/formation protein HypE [Candidatus Dojkabacteria bacterium]
MKKEVLIAHGSGGEASQTLIKALFLKYFKSSILKKLTDSAVFETDTSSLAFTTDSFVVDPIFFQGGDIGKLAVCGTVNDIAVSGAVPKYLSLSFILEEGFPIKDLEKVVRSIAKEAEKAEVEIVTGDTKVVDKGKCDKVFINTAGIGFFPKSVANMGKMVNIRPGDVVIINGSIADHGMAVLSSRQDFDIESDIQSDCACLNHLIQKVLSQIEGVKFMRDPTRGGLATVLVEIASSTNLGVEIDEKSIPMKEDVESLCELLGFDPLYIANEGKFVMVVDKSIAEKVIGILHNNKLGKDSSIIGKVTEKYNGKVVLNTAVGGKRIVDMLTGEQLPRIC